MKEGFRFHSGKTAYSIEGLRRLCEDEQTKAEKHLNDGHIEQWLDHIGERDLAEIAYLIRTNQIAEPPKTSIKILSDHLDRQITYQKILDFLEKNKSINGLYRLCKENPTAASEHLNDGYIEQWLDSIGERDLAEITYQIRNNQNSNKIKTLCKYLDRQITYHKTYAFLEKNKSINGLYRLCKENPTAAHKHLKKGNIEQWLDHIGEKDLADIAYLIRTNQTKFLKFRRKSKINRLILYLKRYIYWQNKLNIRDVNKSIDIILQEYETLRTEILNIFQNRTQLIILGLAAIFTLVGLGLAPLTDFLTTDQITLNHPVSITVKETKNSNNILEFDITPKGEKKLVIEKTIKENKIYGAAIPSIIIFSWIIPLASIYIMYSYLNWTQQITIISEYISHNIEKKLLQLNVNNPKSRLRKKPSKRTQFLVTPLSWETYMKTGIRSNDTAGFLLIFTLFSMITILSIFAGVVILYFDYSQESQTKGFEEAIKTVSSILYTLQVYFTQSFIIYYPLIVCLTLIIVATMMGIILYFIKKISVLTIIKKIGAFLYHKSRKFIDIVCRIGYDWNWLWVIALIFSICFLIYLFFSHNILQAIIVENTTCKAINYKDIFLFLLPVTIWVWCLVKTVHQVIYTWRIRNISRDELKRQQYLEELWN